MSEFYERKRLIDVGYRPWVVSGNGHDGRITAAVWGAYGRLESQSKITVKNMNEK